MKEPFNVRPLVSNGLTTPHEIIEAGSKEEAVQVAQKKHRRLHRYGNVSVFIAEELHIANLGGRK